MLIRGFVSIDNFISVSLLTSNCLFPYNVGLRNVRARDSVAGVVHDPVRGMMTHHEVSRGEGHVPGRIL